MSSFRPLRRSAPAWASVSAALGHAGHPARWWRLAPARFHGVFDTNFTADLTILEEGTKLSWRLKRALVDKQPVALPQFTSCCPAGSSSPSISIPTSAQLSTAKSPQQMFGALAKNVLRAENRTETRGHRGRVGDAMHSQEIRGAAARK